MKNYNFQNDGISPYFGLKIGALAKLGLFFPLVFYSCVWSNFSRATVHDKGIFWNGLLNCELVDFISGQIKCDRIGLWVIKLKKPTILCALNTSRSTEHKQITQREHVKGLFILQSKFMIWEIREARKGLWAFLDYAFRMLIGWAGKLQIHGYYRMNFILEPTTLLNPSWDNVKCSLVLNSRESSRPPTKRRKSANRQTRQPAVVVLEKQWKNQLYIV